MDGKKKAFPVRYMVISGLLIGAAFVSPCFSRAVSAVDGGVKRPTMDSSSAYGISYTTYKITKDTSYSQQSGNTYAASSTLNVVKSDKSIAINSAGNLMRTGNNVDVCLYSEDIYALACRTRDLSDEYDRLMDDMPDIYSKAVVAWQ